jgi:type I restriction-modification system DNA methylase subunit
MPINADKTNLWKADVERSIDFYNDWFIRFAPETYRTQRVITTATVLDAFSKTTNLTRIVPAVLQSSPGLLPVLRMVTAPPLARDRLMGLAYVGKSMISSMEGKEGVHPRLPKQMSPSELLENLQKLCDVLAELIDVDLIPWINSGTKPSKQEIDRAATVIADRMCGASSDPIIRNAQEKRQLATLRQWLKRNGYREISTDAARDPRAMPAGTFTFRLSLPAGKQKTEVNIPIDCVIKQLTSKEGDMPLLIEAKSAGDSTNTNKRRKEEAQKFRQLKEKYGNSTQFMLYLCGYFEPGYLGYEAAEGIDWIWEHRTSDFAQLLSADNIKKIQIRETQAVYAVAQSQPQEARRVVAQKKADSLKSAEERNKLGQFSTPFPLACQIVTKSIKHLPSNLPLTFLEPSVGTGVFFSALMHNTDKSRISEAVGCEIDALYGDTANAIWSPLGLQILHCDFLDFADNPDNFAKFNLLCTNPPYVRHHHLQPELKIRLQTLIAKRLGLQPSGLSGLYVYFMLIADALLAEGAVASWLLPAEFLYVNYGSVLREYLTTRVSLLSIHHFDPDEVQFYDALVSSCIVTYRKGKPSGEASCEMSYGGDYINQKERKTISLSQMRGMSKWTMPHFSPTGTHTTELRIKDMVTVRRGIATGANDYFIINEETVQKYEIPRTFLKPILPSPRFVHEAVIEANPDGTPKVDEFRYLLDCTASPDEVKRMYPGLWAYLEEGVAKGLPTRYLCASRDVWYFQEKREPALFLASYMGRSNDSRLCPIRFFANLSTAVVTNVFLNLYPTRELKDFLGRNRPKILEFLNILNTIPGASVLQAGRAYGGGLHKIEPKELLEVRLSSAPAWLEDLLKRQLVLI